MNVYERTRPFSICISIEYTVLKCAHFTESHVASYQLYKCEGQVETKKQKRKTTFLLRSGEVATSHHACVM